MISLMAGKGRSLLYLHVQSLILPQAFAVAVDKPMLLFREDFGISIR